MTETQFRRLTVLGLIGVVALWLAQPLLQGLLFAETERRLVSPRGELAAFESAASEVFETAAPSVVYIFTERRGITPFGREALQQGTGSGFVWDKAGHVITNQHVVADASRVFVRFDSGEAAPARLVGGSRDHDVAVLRVDAPPLALHPISVGNSNTLVIGQSVFAIGNPFGLSRTLTSGIVSALNRRLPTESDREITGMIQTDAAINPGNSGGPLIDSAGRLVGVNTAIISGSGSYSGIGFAVPVDTVNRIVPQIIRQGRPTQPGIGIEAASEALTARLGIDGVMIVAARPGGPADKAGIEGIDRQARELGDVIVSAGGKDVRTVTDLIEVFEEIGVGNTVTLMVERDGERRQVDVTLADVG